MSEIETTDVLVCGAGPCGLLIALGLEQQGIKTVAIDKRTRDEQAKFGRATTLFPRSMELLEKLDLADDLCQDASISRGDVTYNNGVRTPERGWHVMFTKGMVETYHDYLLNIRQRFSEDIFRSKYEKDHARQVLHGWTLVHFETTGLDDSPHNVTAHLQHNESGEKKTVQCKYLIGADGGSSTVRQLAGVEMVGTDSTLKWIRIDGKMETDMPDANLGFAALETKTHGNVLWVKLDRDTYRVGFSLSGALQEKYKDGITEEQVVAEAVQSMRPFKLKIQRVDWWTLYTIKQKVAAQFQPSPYVLLAGDAAHTHSSGFAQGMNTAIHDATNMVWKLAGTLKGWYPPSTVLPTYESERHTAAEKLISIDRAGSAAISGSIPAEYGGPDANPDQVLLRIFSENLEFSMGLGITYGASCISRQATTGMVRLGSRAPDALIRHPGLRMQRRLQDVFRVGGPGRWTVLVFAGLHVLTKAKVVALRDALEKEKGLGKAPKEMLNFATLITAPVTNAWDAFDGPAIGRLYFDTEGEAHARYCVSTDTGAVFVIRPDGILGFAVGLDQLDEVKGYFTEICT